MAKKNRDDFSETTKLQIAKRAGWLCACPTCRASTVGATSDGEGEINIGTAAHISAASPGGPRYDETISSAERTSVRNGLWLCRDHGKAVDSKDPEFTVERLREWKRQAEIESWRRVLRNEVQREQMLPAGPPSTARMHVAATADLEVFRRTVKWPSTPVALTLELSGFDDPVTTGALAEAVTSLDDLVLVAGPGMGKTTTLFQIAEGLVAKGGRAPLIVPLGDWASEDTSVLDSILKRPAFREVSEDDFRRAAAQPGIVLLLDGWNELDIKNRARARVQVARLKAELPKLGLVVSTRKQALDVPIDGALVKLLPLNEDQQMQIAVAMRGDAGGKIIDQAWRTRGLRELMTIPLYLTTLVSLPENSLFPTTKEEVLRHFVLAHEKEPSHAEVMHAVLQGFQQDYLDDLAVLALRTASTSIGERNARDSILHTQVMLAGQITVRPPSEVLDVLVNSHMLIRAGDTPGYSFQHQQFQEWYASHFVERRILADVVDPEAREMLKAEVFDLPAWEESILFAIERLARGGAHQRFACAKAIIAAFEVDPILAAEMIFRATEEVWIQIATTIKGLVTRWHAPGKVDRALRFMLTSGRPDFRDIAWPLLVNENQQISLKALRNCRRFKASILGREGEQKIRALSPKIRALLLSEIASNSGMDGIDLATTIAKNDPDPEVQASVINALVFRRSSRHVEEVLREAGNESFDLVASRRLVDKVQNGEVGKKLAAAQLRQRMDKTNSADLLRNFLYARDDEDKSDELTHLIGTMEIVQQQPAMGQLVHEARSRYPRAIVHGLLARVRAGLTLFYGTSDILASARLALEDEALVRLALADPTCRDDRAEAAAAVLGADSVGHLVDALLEARSNVWVDGKYDDEAGKIYRELGARIAHVPGPSLASAVLARSAQANTEGMAELSDLLSRHPAASGENARPFDTDAVRTVQHLIEDWGNRMLASDDATRWQKSNIAILASHVPSVNLLPVLRRLLDDNLRLYRAFREQAKATGWRQSDAVNEARQPMVDGYRRAFLAIRTPETKALMRQYLLDEHFGPLAARVLVDQWRVENEQSRPKRFLGGIDFSGVKEKRASRASYPDTTCTEAELIFAAIHALIVEGTTGDQNKVAVELGIVGSYLPHGQRDAEIKKLLTLAPRRARVELLLGLVLSGEEIDTTVVTDGILETFEAAKTDSWILTQGEGWELKAWLRLLPFVNHPREVLNVVLAMPSEYRTPHFLKEMVDALSHSPSEQGEEVLFKLAEQDKRFYANDYWRATVFRLGTSSSAQHILDLTAKGVFESVSMGSWHLTRQLGGLLDEYPPLRASVYGALKNGLTSAGLVRLAEAVAENPDEEGALLLVGFGQDMKRFQIGTRTIEKIITQYVPSEEWEGSFDVVPVPARSLRKRLLELTTDGGPADDAARWLRQIDGIRDIHGIPETEPRHPGLAIGKQWPILEPDPCAAADD